MSHISTWKQTIGDLAALKEVCIAKGYEFHYLKDGQSVNMYGSQTAEGQCYFKLPDWRYPLVVKDGQIRYDNFGAKTTSMDTFGEVLQSYNRTVIRNEIDYSKFSVEETINDKGEIEMVLTEY
jgi:hypothetical protein